jgi:hypothetical protein
MGHVVTGLLAIMTGAMAMGAGWLTVHHALRTTQRAYLRTTARATALEDWHDWFLGGFTGATLGLRWLSGLATGTLWLLAGIALIGLGLRLVCRA